MSRSFLLRRWSACAALAACACAAATVPAAAHEVSTGGASAPERPRLTQAQCGSGDAACPQGEILKLKGEYLDSARTVVFLGRRGSADNRTVRPTSSTPHRVVVRVPSTAASGPVRVISAVAGASSAGPRVEITAPPQTPPASATAGGVFPIKGRYDYGTEVNRFGGGRGHKGQDVFAACGTPVVAALTGRVTLAKWQDRAGNYAVIKADDGTSQAYMHLQKPASVQQGQRVTAGQQIGLVGETGVAQGCHLHFELWTAPGWYSGGEPIDPLPALRGWAAGSGTTARA